MLGRRQTSNRKQDQKNVALDCISLVAFYLFIYSLSSSHLEMIDKEVVNLYVTAFTCTHLFKPCTSASRLLHHRLACQRVR